MAIDFGDFPRLKAAGFSITSDPSTLYNCIAWAAGVDSEWWWPDQDGIWPEGAPRAEHMDAFVQTFSLFGYQPCAHGDYEPGFEKVALYADADGDPSHAARQIGPDSWTSKIGQRDDITHTLEGLEGPCYGAVSLFLKRPIR